MEAIFLFASLIILLLSGIPIFISLFLSSILVTMLFIDTPLMVMVQRGIGGIDKFVLMALPLFIFAAHVMDSGGLSARILSWCRSLVGHISGGLAMTTQLSATFFGALSGSSPATVAAIGKIMYPEMVKNKYPKSFTTGLITSSGSVALLVPPSITMIIYGSSVNVSVGSLFMAGITVGLFYSLLFVIYIYVFSKIKKLPTEPRATAGVLFKETKKAGWSLLVPVIILGGIYSGVFTPTEAAGVAAFYGIIVGIFVYREISFKDLYKIAVESAISSAQVMILISGASSFLWVLTVLQIPQTLTNLLIENINTAVVFLLALNIFLLIVGMFLDPSAGVVIIAPLVAGTAYQLGVDPIHLGLIIVTNLTIGMFTPPFGLNLFVAQGITKVGMAELVRGVLPFIGIALVALLLITYIPSISTFLPNLLMGK